MTYKSFEHFALLAYRSGLECTLDELRQFDEVRALGVIASCARISEILDGYGLSISPPVSEGELDQVRVVERREKPELFEGELSAIRDRGEGHSVEYKGSLYCRRATLFNEKVPDDKKFGDEIVFSCIKTICAFANSDGGTLAIGLGDGGEIEGIEVDFPFIPGMSKNLDGWLLFLRNCIERFIYDARSFLPFLKIGTVFVEGKTVAIIIVRPRKNRLLICRSLKSTEDECVFIRSGASTAELRARGIEELCMARLS